MLDIAGELAVQSWCFRGFKRNEEVIECVKKCGLSTIELCSAHVDFQDENSFEQVIELYAAGGVQIVSIGAVRLSDDEVAARRLFEFVKAADAGFMTVDFAIDSVPESYRVAERLAEEYNVLLGIHNHGGRHWLGSRQAIGQVFAETSERIGLCLDTAWAMDAGEDSVAMAEAFGERLYGLHIKDFVFDRARKPADVVVGTGNLDLPRLWEVLRATGFNGYTVLEYEGDVQDPVPAVRQCVESVRESLQQLRR